MTPREISIKLPSSTVITEMETRNNPVDTSLHWSLPTRSSSRDLKKSTLVIDTIVEKTKSIPELELLPPKDTGKAAYTVLIACTVLECGTYGLPMAYGVFQDFYTSKFVDHRAASWIGVLSCGLPFLGAPLVTHCCQRYTFPRQYYILIGFALCVLSLFLSAFITTLPGLIITQGLLYGVGTLLVDIPLLIILNTWYDKRRGLAYGILFAGADLAGVGYTFLVTEILQEHGLRATFLVLAGITFAVAGPMLFFLKERVAAAEDPSSSTANTTGRRRSSTLSIISINTRTKTSPANLPFSPSHERPQQWPASQPKRRFYQRSIFYVYTLLNLFSSCAYYLPFIYLPSFVTQLGYSKHSAAIVLAILNFAQVIGDLVFGKLSDKVDVNFLIICSMSICSISTYILWGLFGSGNNSFAILIAFGLLFGSFGGGYIALWARMGTVFGERDAQMIYSTLCAGRGVGSILSGPVSQVLLNAETSRALKRIWGGRYAGLVVFTGTCMAGSGILGVLAVLALYFRKDKEQPEGEVKLVSEGSSCVVL